MSRFDWIPTLLIGLSLVACGSPDTDGDFLTDAFEALIGTNPELADSDGDGYSDSEEWLSYFDPQDRDDVPYEGGYPRGPVPEDLEDEGWEEGEVSRDWDAKDQHSDELRLQKFYGNVIVVDIGAEWCPPCNDAAPEAEGHYQEFQDRGFMIFSLLVDGLVNGQNTPDGDRWVEEHDLTYAVIEDPERDVIEHYAPSSMSMPNFSVVDRDLTVVHKYLVGATAVDWEEIEDMVDTEAPYVEWPLPENTVELRDELAIDIPQQSDPHVQANIDLAIEEIGSGSIAGGSGAGGGSNSEVGEDSEDSAGSSSGGGWSQSSANADGSYAAPPWGGASCSLPGSATKGSLAFLLTLVALVGLRRRV
ncbi:MAG: redoxin domain-containing protein [Myxococcota bacterium]|nr:redoxin domain-containing protein [Myxococcota bacterium]